MDYNFIADLHIHSYLSRATSRQCNLEHLYKWAQIKGITVVSSADFTHPKWFSELQEKLLPAEEGLYKLKPELQKAMDEEIPVACKRKVRFILTTEISTIYKKDGRTRKLHSVIFTPNLESASRFATELAKIGNIASDGRPILGLDCKKLLEIVLNLNDLSFLVPAHIWTPHFSVLGAKSGFDSIEECFEELTPDIFALETGLSSDPPMNWRLSTLDRYTLISNSDAHSPEKLGREANLFACDLSFPDIKNSLQTKKDFLGTIEFYPEEGKYHYDGHRKCLTRMSPEETRKNKGLCPKCGRPVTVGVMHRVEELADRQDNTKPKQAKPFHSLIPLKEIIGKVLRCGPNTKKVNQVYWELLSKLGSEIELLMLTPETEWKKITSPVLVEAIRRMRTGKINIAAGYDGEYGEINIFAPGEQINFENQHLLF